MQKNGRQSGSADRMFFYVNMVRLIFCSEPFEYLLDKKYSKFKGTLYLPKGETKTDSVTMTLTADGEKIYESPAMTTSSSPVDFEVDLSQCNDFKISFSVDRGWGPYLCVGNAYLYDAQ